MKPGRKSASTGEKIVDAVLRDILGPEGSCAAYLLIVLDVLLSHWPATRDALVPFVANPNLLANDRTRLTPDGPVLGLFRKLAVPREQASMESLVASLIGKYGESIEQYTPSQRRHLNWKINPAESQCRTFQGLGGEAPPIPLAKPPTAEQGSPLPWADVVGSNSFWPDQPVKELLDPKIIDECRLMISAFIDENPDGYFELSVWMLDIGAMMRALSDPSLAPAPTAQADINL